MDVLLIAMHPGGGIRTYLRYVFSTPVMGDLNVSLITPATQSGEFFKEHFRTATFTHHETGVSIRNFGTEVAKIIGRERPSVIHSHGFTAGVMAAIPARIFRIPHILTSHDVFLPSQFTGLKGGVRKWAMGRLLGVPDVINPVGKDACKNLTDTYPTLSQRAHLRPIRNGIQSDYFLSDHRRPLREELGIGDDTILLGFFGRFMGQKGFPMLRDAVETLNSRNQGFRFEVACFGWGGFIREEQALLRERELDQYFHFLPGTDDMNAALRGVDAAVMPSRWEACPLLPMEALVSGTVVISSDCVGMKEVTEDTPALTFTSEDVTALIERLQYLARHMKECKDEAESFRNQAAERFDASVTAAAVRELYNRMARY